MSIDIKSLGYLRAETTDLDAWRTFGSRVLGLAPGRGPHPEHLYFRLDDQSARIVVTEGSRNELSCSGWEVADHRALQAARDRLDRAGVAFEIAGPATLAERQVQGMIRFADPFGNVLELFHGARYESRPAVSAYGTRFVTGDQGLGHLVLPVTDDADGLAFYTDVLGFRLRDSMRMPGEYVGGEPGSTVWLRFLGCNPRHHSLALVVMDVPARCVHIMIEVAGLDDVGRALERVRRHGATLSATLGRHLNDEMVSFYVRSPSGFDVEYGCSGLQVDDRTWVARESTAASSWGHAFAS